MNFRVLIEINIQVDSNLYSELGFDRENHRLVELIRGNSTQDIFEWLRKNDDAEEKLTDEVAARFKSGLIPCQKVEPRIESMTKNTGTEP